MSYKESDWKLFRKLIPVWQERYITKLNKEYIGILIQDKNASTIFWELNDRIKKDRNSPGVILEMSRSLLVENLISLIKHNVITLDELNDFSEETKESIQIWLNL
jgi:hypothetical protein